MQKQRVSRACDTCKRRKIRCTGKQPCAHCIKNNKSCEFKAIYTRGALPEVSSAPLEEQEKFLEEVGYKRRQVWRPSPSRRTTAAAAVEASSKMDEDVQDEDESEDGESILGVEDENPKQTLPTRRHQEFTSSAFGYDVSSTQTNTFRSDNNKDSGCTSLFERTQHHLNRPSYHQKNPIAAYGDPPLPEIDTPLFILPSEATAQALMSKYFDFVSATNRILHRPTVERWTSALLSPIRRVRTGHDENSHRAVVLMVFALTYRYMGDECSDWDANTGFYYFQAASLQLTQETGPIRLSTIQARLLQCLFLLSRSRINQCYNIFGTIVNLIFTLGIYRSKNQTSTSDLLEFEMQKRVFWSAYIMDKYLSSALGRPQLLKDEDVEQDLPLLMEDENLPAGFMQTVGGEVMIPMKAAIYQIKLSQLISHITATFYKTPKNTLTLTARLSSSTHILSSLLSWRSETSHFLELDPGLLPPLYMRQNTALQLSYSQARIILHRPFLLDLFNTELDLSAPGTKEGIDDNVEKCTEAALEVVDIIDGMWKKVGSSFSASWFAHYVAYTATIALYLHIIQLVSPSLPPSTSTTLIDRKIKTLFEKASKCQEQIRPSTSNSTLSGGEKESFAQKCSIVLEEARAEAVLKLRSYNNSRLQSESHALPLDPSSSSSTANSSSSSNPPTSTSTSNTSNPPIHLPFPSFSKQQQPPTQHLQQKIPTTTNNNNNNNRSQPRHPQSLSSIQGETSFFGGDWGDMDMNFDQSAPGGGVLYSLFNFNSNFNIEGLDGNRVRDRNVNLNVDTDEGMNGGGNGGGGNGEAGREGKRGLADRIDRWGFSSLTGY